MKATVYRNGKPETFDITHFELINNKNKYISMFPNKKLATIKDIITIDLMDLQEVAITEDENEK
jgi:hypothetical protein